MRVPSLLRPLTIALGLAFAAQPALAQGLFDPVIIVNEDVVTRWELEQRIQMLETFRTPGDLEALAREQLVEDRLKLAELDRAGLELTADGLTRAMTDFAGRADLELDQFLQLLAQNGVEEETFRDFVRVGATWRQYIQQRFGRQAEVSDADIDAALGAPTGANTEIEVLLNEIIIPAPPPEAARALAQAQAISRLTSTAAFEAQARQVSALPSRENGGRLDWLPISNYPGQLRSLILNLAPGEVTAPIQIPNGVALFQMRDVREVATTPVPPDALDYAVFYIPGGLTSAGVTEAARVAAMVDTCDDLYGVAFGLPEEQLEREERPLSEIPQDIAMELAKLDPNEHSAVLTRNDGNTLMFLMLCARIADAEAEPDRDAIAGQIRAQRLNGYGAGLLADLRAQATIIGE